MVSSLYLSLEVSIIGQIVALQDTRLADKPHDGLAEDQSALKEP